MQWLAQPRMQIIFFNYLEQSCLVVFVKKIRALWSSGNLNTQEVFLLTFFYLQCNSIFKLIFFELIAKGMQGVLCTSLQNLIQSGSNPVICVQNGKELIPLAFQFTIWKFLMLTINLLILLIFLFISEGSGFGFLTLKSRIWIRKPIV